jgi:hypothetical protein
MARSRYLISFEGKKRHVSREERDELLLIGALKQIGPQEYLCTLQPVTYHSLSELGQLHKQMTKKSRQEPDCYPGSFIWEFKERRYRERLESSEALVLRLPAMQIA